MSKKVLITGSSGFIGKNLTTYLLDNKIKKKIKTLPYWKQKFTIEKDLLEYINENN